MYVCVCVYVCMYTGDDMIRYACMYACMDVCMSVDRKWHDQSRMHAYMYVCMYVYACLIHTCMHAHSMHKRVGTHTQTCMPRHTRSNTSSWWTNMANTYIHTYIHTYICRYLDVCRAIQDQTHPLGGQLCLNIGSWESQNKGVYVYVYACAH